MQIKELISTIPVIPADARLQELGGGNVNQTWKISGETETWVLRIDTPLASRFGLNRAHELRAVHAAEITGLAPEVVWSDVSRGLLLTRFIDGRPWVNSGADAVASLAAAINKLHKLRPDLPSNDFGKQAALYAKLLATEEAAQLANQCQNLAARWCNDPERYVLCHNDLGPANVLRVESGLKFLDWEYAAVGEPCFDFAAVAATNQFDSAVRERFLQRIGRAADADRFEGCRRLYDRLAALWLMLACQADDAPRIYKSQLVALRSRLSP